MSQLTPRSMASATLAVGLVSVPVEFPSRAERREEVHLHTMSKASGQRAKQQRVALTTDKVVPLFLGIPLLLIILIGIDCHFSARGSST